MKTKIFLDFDGTLHDTNKSKESLFSAFEDLGFGKSDILAAYIAECEDAKFTVNGFAERICGEKNELITHLKVVADNITAQAQKRIYPDVIPFISSIDRRVFELNLITVGDVSFQKEKVLSSGISTFFDNIYYTSDTPKWIYLADIVSKYERFFLIDDRSDTIHEVAKRFLNAIALEIDRKSEDKDDPVRNCEKYNNVRIFNMGEIGKFIG